MFTFYLMTEKGYEVLKAVINAQLTPFINRVVAAKDKSVQKDFFIEIQELCRVNNISFFEKNSNTESNSNYSFAVSWRWLISASNLIVLHDSLLPRYRGFAPLVTALINGDKHVGVTCLFANKDFDKGDIIAQRTIEISYPIKIEAAIKMLALLYADIVIEIMQILVYSGTLYATAQDETKATYSLWRDEDDYAITWIHDATSIERFVNAVGFPFRGACATIDKKTVRVKDVEQVQDVLIENRTPGKVIFMDTIYPVVVCGKGLLKIKQLTWEDGTSALPLKKFRIRFK